MGTVQPRTRFWLLLAIIWFPFSYLLFEYRPFIDMNYDGFEFVHSILDFFYTWFIPLQPAIMVPVFYWQLFKKKEKTGEDTFLGLRPE